MKRIYTTLALVGAMVTGAFAQRVANISGTLVTPSDTVIQNVGCADSFEIAYYFINSGPDVILPTDTLQFADARLNPYYSAFQVTGDTIKMNDTAFKTAYYVSLSEMKFLWDASNNNDPDTVASTFNGNFLYPIFFGGYGWSAVSTAVTDDNQDDDQLAVAMTISCATTGVSKVNLNKTSLNVYPNPASSQINFSFNFAANTDADLRITDISGRVVKSITLGKQNAGNKTFNIDVADLNNGMYFMELTTNQSRGVAKFSKN